MERDAVCVCLFIIANPCPEPWICHISRLWLSDRGDSATICSSLAASDVLWAEFRSIH